MSGVLHGLHAAHEARGDHNEALGIVHRDVSPQNVIVGIDGVARVLDFGVAKAAGRLQTTRDGQLKGKLAYMAPEQVRGEAVTRRTDIYAASVVLWETLTCRRLFKADNEAHALARVLSGNAAAPSSLVPDIPAELDAVVARGLHLDPQQRYATAREMASALEAVVQPAPTTDVAEWVEQCAAVDDAGDGAAEAATAQGSHSSWSMKAMRSLPAAMQQPLPTDEPPTRVAKLEEPRSGVSSVSVAHTPAPVLTKPRTKLAIVAAAGFVVFVGTVAVAFTMGRGSREAAPALSSGPPAATTTVTTQPAVSIAAPVVSAVPPPPMDSIPVVSVSALPKPQTQAPPPPHVVHTSAPTSDCNPPYTTDAKGHVHFKPQCM
jgi:serine/threonine-protein kinase